MGRKLLCILLALLGIAMAAWFKPRGDRRPLAGFPPQVTLPEATVEVLSKPQVVTFPYVLENGTLVAEFMQSYDGLFMEDGSNGRVEGVAALMVRNAGDRDISSAMVTLEQNGKKLHFFLTWLPAGGRVLVLEHGRAMYTSGEITGCSAAAVRWEQFETAGIQVEESGDGQLLVTNEGGRAVRNLRLRYKLYEIEGDYYVGGITYCTYVGVLLSGEGRTVLPQRYAVGHTQVVAVLAD